MIRSVWCKKCCNTKYPILLLHGMGFHDRMPIHYYWGRIPRSLRKHGAIVFMSCQDGNATVADNALQLQPLIQRILQQTGAEKINIIAHSKGGLEARYLVSTMNMGDCIASITTLATPHNGSKTLDWLLPRFQPFIRFFCGCFDQLRRLLGDHKPNTYSVIRQITTIGMRQFNAQNPDDPKVFYQSYAFVMQHPFSDLIMAIPNAVVSVFEGKNDGLISPSNAKWTNFRGIYYGVTGRGISHPDEADYRRIPFRFYKPDKPRSISDITRLYIAIARGLRLRGF